VYTGFWWGNLRGRDYLEDPGIDGRIEIRGVYRVLVGKPEGKRLFGRPRHRWQDNIKMNL